ncbi:transcriptional regulator, MarR family [Parvibaculum lavamentivorans DS-1]|uniref:Transcriptional regulator, MarR family n=1 Tax=Parvibaculum lavamentivorans (strain DS-1 / DSM 13023 / NCIMB 13966) TaxID=402881 RepID=A7HU85_PARL1|nr:winged helix DNA-binding protein [Parvibaculum lavamentivorans]ABS63468.1 transcriptional regulator, MarR family [Parvibaculum lavamentivorans DS-1]
MIPITQNLPTPAVITLVDPDCAERLRDWNAAPAADQPLNLSWQIAGSRGAVKDRLLRDQEVRVVVIAASSGDDPLLRDLARNCSQLPGHAWLHLLLVTSGPVTTPLLTQLRHFSSWSVLAAPCDSRDLGEALGDAIEKSAEQHRLAMLSAAIRADAEDILVRTRNIVGALCHGEVPAALGNLIRIADRLGSGEGRELPATGRAAQPMLQPAPPPRSGQAAAGQLLSEEDANRHWTRSLIELCSARQNYFPEGLFSDPAWDMLLDLTYARLAGKRVSVSSLCIASRVPATTALRRIGDLVSQGLAARKRDEADGRRVFVELTEDGFSRMLTYIDNIQSMLNGEPRARLRKI